MGLAHSGILRAPETGFNPFCATQFEINQAEPCVLVIFGATGDLTARKLVPALFNLFREGKLPTRFCCVGFARRDKDSQRFRQEMYEAVKRFSRNQLFEEESWQRFSELLHYHCADFVREEGFDDLRVLLGQLDQHYGTQGNRIYYLSTQPKEFSGIVDRLSRHGLIYPYSERKGDLFSRLIIEKPFGHDLASAESLQEEISQAFDERQIYRIDHYLGKETVQNLLVFRFTNAIFESLWNRNHIEQVQITVAEDMGIGTRGRLFENAGILRDLIQNHAMQLLSLIAMEAPGNLSAQAIHAEKVKVLNAIRPLTEDDLLHHVVRGQYSQGYIDGELVPGYREEADVAADSNVETYAAIRLLIDNWRWEGVPFYIRAGKRLPKRVTEIAVTFNAAPGILYPDAKRTQNANTLVIRIQPKEGISLKTNCKIPGQESLIQPVKLDFLYENYFGRSSPEAYERLIRDCMAGDPTLFAPFDEVFASWQRLTPILDMWNASPPQHPFPNYRAGEWGPVEADEMLHRTGRRWRLI